MTVVIVDQIDYLNPLLKPVDQAGDSGVYVRQWGCGQLYKLPGSCKDRGRLGRLGLDYPIRVMPGPGTEAGGVRADRIRLVGDVDPGFPKELGLKPRPSGRLCVKFKLGRKHLQ